MMMNTIITVALGVSGKDIGYIQRGARLGKAERGVSWRILGFLGDFAFQCGQEERY